VIDLDFGEDGLLPVVALLRDGTVLMHAHATPEAVARTVETGEAHYYSRSRDELWHKGATSGHVQRVETVRVDCDADALLYVVDQTGGACHTGHASCFHRRVESVADGGERVAVETDSERVFDPEDVYDDA
jgi:phosphoribosyl-AMP cyclohydrolase